MHSSPLHTYDYLTRARQRVFDGVRPLAPSDYTRTFPIGLGSLARTLTHIMTSEWYYLQRMLGREVPPDDQWPIREDAPPPFAILESAWGEQARSTRAALSTVRDWDAPIEYRVTPDDGRPVIVTCTGAGLFTQLAFHEVHHRAQALNMLRHLGATIEGDLDFNAMMFDRRPTS